MALKGILFDMDGVLVDSEAYIFEAARLMFLEHGVVVTLEDAMPFVGTGENRYLSGMGERQGFEVDIERDKARTYAIYGEITRGRLKPLPGVVSFIHQCRSRGLKLAVASSADRVKIDINLREMGISPTTFDGIVSGQEVEHKKPFPDIFIKAAQGIGLHPNDCLVVEDAISGVTAGKSAGARCLALTTSFAAHQLAEADWICNNLADVPTAALDW
jgi:beta-phosphoglucomutase